jgi:hypothetical protein
MNDGVITDVGQLDISWFNRVLAQREALVTGGVSAFAVEPQENACSRSARIRLAYAGGSTGSLPSRLFLKMCSAGSYAFGPSEVQYYARDYMALADPPIPTCYDAQYSSDPRRYHILMEDLSETHRSNWRTPPTEAYGCAVAEALAALHAHWWATGPRGAAGIEMPGETEIERYIAHIRPGLLPMLESAAGEIDESWRGTLSEIFEKHPPCMVERTKRREGFTLVHGDVNPGNILSPIDGHHPVYLLDRQPFDWSLAVWLGVSDLSYLMAHWWETDVRRKLELPVLRQYHESLRRRGVSGYGWEELLSDYRLCVVQSIYVATEWCVVEEDRTKMKWVWLPQLRKSMATYFDHCSDM